MLRNVALVWLLTACATGKGSAESASRNQLGLLAPGSLSSVGPDDKPEEVAAKEGLQVRFFDLNHDGRADVHRFFRVAADPQNPAGHIEILVRKEIDLNQDGRFDLVRLYAEDGQLKEERDDLDFDGNVDQVTTYEKGVLSRKALDLDFDGQPDVVKYYAGGKLVRIESDRAHRGKIDTWEYYENDALDRIGLDTDGDGQVDTWERQASAESKP